MTTYSPTLLADPADTPAPDRQQLPWYFTAAAVVALAALGTSSRQYAQSLLLAFLILLPHAIPLRLPRGKILGWVVRVLIWAAILSFAPPRRQSGMSLMYGGSVLFEPDYAHLFGFFAAAEVALRLWTYRPNGPSRGDALLLTALVFAAGTNTYRREAIQILAPAYSFLLLLCARGFSKHPRPRSPDRARRRRALLTLRAAAFATALGLAFTAVFLVTEYEYKLTRWAMQYTRNRPASASDTIGLSSSPTLQASFNPHPSLNRVLLIRGPRLPAELHVRAMAFDRYADQQWRPLMQERAFQPVPANELLHREPGPHLQYVRLAEAMSLLLAPLHTAAIVTDQRVDRDELGTLRAADAFVGETYESTLASNESFQGPAATAPLDDDARKRLLEIPDSLDPRVLELARRITAGASDPAARLLRIQSHLAANHKYSLTFQPQGEPLNDFLLHNRAGHCQYFASSAVVLARAAGIPARFVTGYLAHEPYGHGALVVRDRDAHAWAECYLEGAGWITVDATPATGQPPSLFPDTSTSRRLWERLQDAFRSVREFFAHLGLLTLAMFAAIPGAIIATYSSLRWLLRRWRKRPGAPITQDYATPKDEALRDAARRFEQALKLRLIPLHPTQTWRESLTAISTPPAPHTASSQCATAILAVSSSRQMRHDTSIADRPSSVGTDIPLDDAPCATAILAVSPPPQTRPDTSSTDRPSSSGTVIPACDAPCATAILAVSSPPQTRQNVSITDRQSFDGTHIPVRDEPKAPLSPSPGTPGEGTGEGSVRHAPASVAPHFPATDGTGFPACNEPHAHISPSPGTPGEGGGEGSVRHAPASVAMHFPAMGGTDIPVCDEPKARSSKEQPPSGSAKPTLDPTPYLRFLDAYDDARFGHHGPDSLRQLQQSLTAIERETINPNQRPT